MSTGRVHELRERADEPEWAAKHVDTIEGNALSLPPEIESVDAIVTSPTYGNRMADHHEAQDESTRHTYKHALGRDLADDNSGTMQWGDDYREFHRKAWAESVRVLKPDGLFIINIKDHIRGGEKQEVAAWHVDTLCRELNLRLVGIDFVPSRGLMAGDNHAQRVAGEFVFTFQAPALCDDPAVIDAEEETAQFDESADTTAVEGLVAALDPPEKSDLITAGAVREHDIIKLDGLNVSVATVGPAVGKNNKGKLRMVVGGKVRIFAADAYVQLVAREVV